jgi:hypothetical protein
VLQTGALAHWGHRPNFFNAAIRTKQQMEQIIKEEKRDVRTAPNCWSHLLLKPCCAEHLMQPQADMLQWAAHRTWAPKIAAGRTARFVDAPYPAHSSGAAHLQ